jgi:hypothetical protein
VFTPVLEITALAAALITSNTHSSGRTIPPEGLADGRESDASGASEIR